MNLSANWPHQNKKKLVNTDRSIEIKPTETQEQRDQINQAKYIRAVGQFGIHVIGEDRERTGKGNT